MWQTLVIILELAGGFGRYFLEILRIQALNNLDSLFGLSVKLGSG